MYVCGHVDTYLTHSSELKTHCFTPRVPDTELTKCVWHSFKAKANTALPSWFWVLSHFKLLLPVCAYVRTYVSMRMYICVIYIMMLLEVYCIYSCSNLHCGAGALVLDSY